MNDAAALAAIGELIAVWNTTEDALRLVLRTLLGHNKASEAIAAEMGSASLCNAIRAAAAHSSLGVRERKIVVATIEVFERYREYRNYYVHGLRGSERTQHDSHAQIKLVTGKGQVRIYEDKIGVRALNRLIAQMAEFALHTLVLSHALGVHRNGGQFPFPEIPPLPDKLHKRSPSQLI